MKNIFYFSFFILFFGCTKTEIINVIEKTPPPTIEFVEFLNSQKNQTPISNKIEYNYKFDIGGGSFQFEGDLKILSVYPDTMFFQVSGPFGVSLVNFLITENKIKIYDNLKGKIETISDLDSIKKLIYPYSFQNFIDILFGVQKFTSVKLIPDSINVGDSATVFVVYNDGFDEVFMFNNFTKSLSAYKHISDKSSVMLIFSGGKTLTPFLLDVRFKDGTEGMFTIENFNTNPSFNSIKSELPDDKDYK